MIKTCISLFFVFFMTFNTYAADFTVASYNAGGLSDHYDYLRAATMNKLMQERYNAEPEQMAQVEKIQQLALKILFCTDPKEKDLAQQVWKNNNFQELFDTFVTPPTAAKSPNKFWFEQSEKMLTSYHVRPVQLSDQEVDKMLVNHLKGLNPDNNESNDYRELIANGRSVMAQRIFHHYLKYDIICLQEASYLEASMFPEQYQLLLSEISHSINGIAWNTNRFELIQSFGDTLNKAYAVLLLDKTTEKTVLIASAHITGCNPFKVIVNEETGASDSEKGDDELKTIVQSLDEVEADFKIIGMDSNVTPTHPRLEILKNNGYALDYENHLEVTCTNPYQILNTRLDWISIKSEKQVNTKILNIPILNVGLNSIETNVSDHKPVAVRISY